MPFDDIVGHDTAKEVLKRAIRTGRVAHAYLFEGPSRVGKTLAAVTFAKALMCCQPSEAGEACEECTVCRGVERGNHPDYLLLRPTIRLEGSDEESRQTVAGLEGAMIRTEDIGRLVERAHGKPVSARRKVIVVAEAHAMNDVAANHLLKTLEEPPPKTTIILTATSGANLLPTIVSRCQPIRFGPVSTAQTQAALERFFPNTDQALIRAVAAFSGGRPGYARRLLEHPDALRIREQLIGLVLELPQQPQVFCLKAAEQLTNCAEAWWKATTEGRFSDALLKQNRDRVLRTQMVELLDLLLTWFRDLAIAGDRNSAPLLINADHTDDLIRQASTAPNCLAAAAAVREAKEALHGNANLRLTVEVMLIRIHQALTAGGLPVTR